MKNLIWKLKDLKFRFLKKLVYKYGRVIDNKSIQDRGDKEKFEGSLLRLLRKYKIIDSTSRIQHLEIVADAHDLPKIKIETLIV